MFLNPQQVPTFKHIKLLDNEQFPHRFEDDVMVEYFESMKKHVSNLYRTLGEKSAPQDDIHQAFRKRSKYRYTVNPET